MDILEKKYKIKTIKTLKENMIGYIKWEIKKISDKEVCILTNSWIWYNIHINERTYSKIMNNTEIGLYIYHHITENSESLFWFIYEDEEELFKELIKISWIWWKVATNILWMWIDNLISAIQNEDQKAVESIKWIWKRWAQKIILEMKDKDIVKNKENTNKLKQEENKTTSKYSSEVFETLVWMWFNENKVSEILSNLPDDIENIEDVIPYAIKKLSS